jgi:hypothetical protein
MLTTRQRLKAKAEIPILGKIIEDDRLGNKVMWYQTKSKYHNKSSVYDGYYYASKLEAGHAQNLDILKKAGKVKKWERQIPIDLMANGVKICRYYCDFKVWWKDGRVTLEETKGIETDVYRIKRKLLEALYLPAHPEIDEYIVIK